MRLKTSDLLRPSATLLLALALLLPAPARAADGTAPRKVVDDTGQAVIKILQDDSIPTEQKRVKIEEVVSHHFDFATLSRLVLAQNWKKLTPEQQQQFTQEFRTHLSVT
ncbi:MAG TPA: ABC transporter substrate-binding protein, partial [Terriglobales bacterium]|nr:ABC transporter substrate-binding protein [Terriglobales bacterium]